MHSIPRVQMYVESNVTSCKVHMYDQASGPETLVVCQLHEMIAVSMILLKNSA